MPAINPAEALGGRAVLVTGGSGFIGQHLAQLCGQEGAIVTCLGHANPGQTSKLHSSVQQVTGDVTKATLDAIGIRPEVIFHCAGGSSVGLSISEPHRDFHRTLDSTAAVLEYARTQAQAAVVVIVSSAAVYGNTVAVACEEGGLIRPVSPYGLYKKISEEMAAMYSTLYGLRCIAVRLFSIYGPELRKQLLWDACRKLSSSGPAQFGGTGIEERDWLHVADACNLLLLAAKKAPPGFTVINGGAGVAHRVRDVVELLSTELQSTLVPGFDGVARPGDPPRLVADIRLAAAMGFAPRVTMTMGLREYAHWFTSLQ
jgi:UDP-glucose 4-epimerase